MRCCGGCCRRHWCGGWAGYGAGFVVAQGWGDEGGGGDGAEIGHCGGDLAKGLVDFAVLGEGDEGSGGTEDAGFFAGDFGESGAEVVLVVEGDVGDDGEERVDDVGGVETSAEAHFEDGDLGVALGKPKEGDSGEALEEADGVCGRECPGITRVGGGVVDAEVEAGEVVVRDGVKIDGAEGGGDVGGGVFGGDWRARRAACAR